MHDQIDTHLGRRDNSGSHACTDASRMCTRVLLIKAVFQSILLPNNLVFFIPPKEQNIIVKESTKYLMCLSKSPKLEHALKIGSNYSLESAQEQALSSKDSKGPAVGIFSVLNF